MIHIRRSTETGLEAIEHPTRGSWINVIDPSPDEVRQVARELNLAVGLLASPLDLDEIPRAEKVDEALLIVARIPHAQGVGASIPFVTRPVGIIVKDDWVLTVSRPEHDLLRDLDDEHRRDLSTLKPHRFVLHLLWGIPNIYLRHLNEMNQAVDQLEDRLQRALQNREVLALLRYQKSLVHFTTALETNELMLERLRRAGLLELEPDDQDMLDDVVTENQEAMRIAEIASDILSQTMDAFASIISNNLNVVMKFLASVTVVLIIPQIIGTFYGMNVGLPIEEHPFAFLVMVGLSVAISAVIGFIFWKKGWL